ncbi:MAG: RNA methyltransferase, TrmH family [Cytophagales bacterium]|jgi:TrmH family RNA methyltransferase|nr:RNA methyltransferase [Bacteroidota bacterium]MBS1980320.1 RNA methyltransferase [Bacteroidota bacterium]WHZ08848.1 MAG: RNA methyltransferase, TrmH family [Cytophagales bacterium]
MLSKAKIKFAKSLQVKKYRKEAQSFVVEGEKSIVELLTSDFEVVWLAGSTEFLDRHEHLVSKKTELIETNEKELAQLGSFQTNGTAIAVVKMKPNLAPVRSDEFCLALDDLKDPGNVGTIIRTADWYGIKSIIASEETADFYNSKTISATMGSFCRVQVYYTDLSSYLKQKRQPVYGAFMEGEDVHQAHFETNGILVIGSESHGISEKLSPFIDHRITISRIGRAESLNAAMATGIILDNVFRSKK